MSPQNLLQLLERAASQSAERRLSFYAPGKRNAQAVRQLKGIAPGSVILLHFNNHFDNVEWLWSVIAAGYLPAISTPMANDAEARKRHLNHLQQFLGHPVVLTSDSLRPEFAAVDSLNIQTIEEVRSLSEEYSSASSENEESKSASSDAESRYSFAKSAATSSQYGFSKQKDDVAILMLTSGSSGNAKAVCLRHGQILQAIDGKKKFHGTASEDTFLNFIGLDHVANLAEVHLQVADLLSNPATFFDLVHQHRAAYSFVPNFFLASLKRTLGQLESPVSKSWDLSCLRALISGDEANMVEMAASVTDLMSIYKAPASFIRPGFGMTETCAGSIYNNDCPAIDIENNREFASLGSCIPGLNMRISLDNGTLGGPNQVGGLELSGPILFQGYRNNARATREAFTKDGWFITGDLVFLDGHGHLNLAGRSKETIIINGVKYFPHELEAAIEEANIAGVTPSYTAVFPHRPKGSDTEVLCVVYLPTYEPDDITARVSTSDQIAKVSVMQSGARPYAIIPLEKSLLPKSSLGKLSRAKTRTAFESGAYAPYQAADEKAIKAYRAERIEQPSNETEEAILNVFSNMFEVPRDEVGTNTSLFDWSVSSIEIIKLKSLIEKELKVDAEIPIITVMTNPTIKGLAVAVKKLTEPHVYGPIVALQPNRDKTPIFLIHPGVGEILVFLNLAKYITDRPVHTIRARGFDEGEEFFKDIPEIVHTYHAAIKRTQPQGPYALAGYSYGAMLAFETAKLLEGGGDEVKFLGSFNLPPHIKFRMRQLDWIEVLLNLSYFLDLISDGYAHDISPDMHKLSHSEVLDFILSKARPERMSEMALTKEKLESWASLSHMMHVIAHHYDPSGSIKCMNVFYVIPLQAVSKNKDEWKKNHLSKWHDFVREDVRWTKVDGAHYTMMGSEYVVPFQKKLRHALAERGL